MANDERLLVADLGGTWVRFALVDAGRALQAAQVLPADDDFASVVERYLDAVGRPPITTFACAAAGPVAGDGSLTMTNRRLRLDPALLQAASGARRALLVNDFAAVAHALPVLDAVQLAPCGGGEPDPAAPALLLGPGTGLGVAAAWQQDGRWTVLPSEAGHIDLAPVDDEELAAWQRLRRDGRVSAESVLSGPGLQRLHRALGGAERTPAEIDHAAAAGEPIAVRTQRLFTRWLGRVAGNLALAFDARRGVYLAGGIVPRWGAEACVEQFRAGFEDKAPMQARLAEIPSFVVTEPYPALLGLARVALVGEQ